MYAIVEVGAKQYSVKKGDVIEVEKQDSETGREISISSVLLTSEDKRIEVGSPYVQGASIRALVLKHTKSPKQVSFKYRRRKSSHWKKGHRQQLTRLEIKEIEAA